MPDARVNVPAQVKPMIDKTVAQFPKLKAVATTLRETHSTNRHDWAAVLWRRIMGSTVLASPKSPSPALRLYAHCLAGKPGGVAVLAINTGEASQRVRLGGKGQSWTLTGQPLDTRSVLVNGKMADLDANGGLGGLGGEAMAGSVTIPGQAIAFYAVPGARNPACQ